MDQVKRKTIISMVLMIICITLLTGQTPAEYEQFILDMAENETGETVEELNHNLSRFLDEPLQLNLCTENDLHSSGLFSPFQVYGILKTREKYGNFFSTYELASIPGFDIETVEKIRPFITIDDLAVKDAFTRPKIMMITNLSNKLPKAAGYRDTDTAPVYYPGSNFGLVHRMKLQASNQITAAFAAEKDPGEKFIKSGVPEHFAGYIQYAATEKSRLLQRILLGNYRIHRGLGLVNSTAFSAANLISTMRGYRRSFVKPFNSTMESGYLNGLYLSGTYKSLESDLYFSRVRPDISFYNYPEKTDLFNLVRTTGLHRSPAEIGGSGMANLYTVGGAFNRKGMNSYSGIAISAAFFCLNNRGRDSLEIKNPMTSFRLNTSLYTIIFSKNYEVFGEAAIDKEGSPALMLGAKYRFNPALMGNIILYRFSPGFMGTADGAASVSENKKGVEFAVELNPFSYAKIRILTEISGNIIPENHRISSYPEYSQRLEFEYRLREKATFLIRYTLKEKTIQSMQTADFNPLSSQGKHQVRTQFQWPLREWFEIQGGFYNNMLARESKMNSGSLIFSQFKLTLPSAFSILWKFIIFHNNDWENRIYIYEPGVLYGSRYPAMTGSGKRNILVISFHPVKKFTIRIKAGISQFDHTRLTGSGYEERIGDKTSDLVFQFQMKF